MYGTKEAKSRRRCTLKKLMKRVRRHHKSPKSCYKTQGNVGGIPLVDLNYSLFYGLSCFWKFNSLSIFAPSFSCHKNLFVLTNVFTLILYRFSNFPPTFKNWQVCTKSVTKLDKVEAKQRFYLLGKRSTSYNSLVNLLLIDFQQIL